MRLRGDLGQDRITKLLLTLSLPAMIGMTVQALYNIIDTFWVGKIGAGEAIAALTICFPIQMIMIAIASGTGIGLTSIIARRLGENKLSEAYNSAEHGLVIVVIYGIIITTLGLTNVDSLLHLFGVTPELFQLSKDYIFIILMGSVFLFFVIISGSMIQAEGNSGIPMLSMVVGAVTNMILDPFLIFGIGPFPELGVQGAAIATLIAQFLSCLINFWYLFLSNKTSLIISLHKFRFKLKIITEIYKVGLPSMVMQIVNSLIIVALNWILGDYGYRAIGAMGIYFAVQSLVFMPIMGLNQGLIPIVGFAYGAKRLDRMIETIKKASIVAFLIMSAGFLCFQLIPGTVISIFNKDPELVEMGIMSMRNISILLPLVGPSIIMTSSFQAVGKGFTAMWLSLLRQVVLLLPALFLLPRWLGLRGVWLSFPLSDFISISITLFIFISFLKSLHTDGFPQDRDMIKQEEV
ncbi:MAG TPA: MATE family efflux transporter [Syntrophomonadaceae bacterium]|nr:MATE family efflux transporter [Syntrophomonadaceae bacterium]